MVQMTLIRLWEYKTMSDIHYDSWDRSYEAQIINRVVFSNNNSKATRVGRRYQIQSIYSSGERASYYNGVYSFSGAIHNCIGVELVRRRSFYHVPTENLFFYEPLLAVYIDGRATYKPSTLRYDLGSFKSNKIDAAVRDTFDVFKTLECGTLLLKRKMLCPKFVKEIKGGIILSDILLSKYNSEEAIDVI